MFRYPKSVLARFAYFALHVQSACWGVPFMFWNIYDCVLYELDMLYCERLLDVGFDSVVSPENASVLTVPFASPIANKLALEDPASEDIHEFSSGFSMPVINELNDDDESPLPHC